MKKVVLLFLALLSLGACMKDDIVLSNAVETGNIVGRLFVTDQGVNYQIKEDTTESDISALKRAIIVCDVLKKVNENTYDIHLKDFAEMFIQEAEVLEDAQSLSKDPCEMMRCWLSGNYINLQLRYYINLGSTKEHDFRILYEEPVQSDGQTLRLRIEHLSSGEYYGAENFNVNLYSPVVRYLSIPIQGLIGEQVQSFPVEIKLFSNKYFDGQISVINEELTLDGTLSR